MHGCLGGCLHGDRQDVGGSLHCGKEVPIVDEIILEVPQGFLTQKLPGNDSRVEKRSAVARNNEQKTKMQEIWSEV